MMTLGDLVDLLPPVETQYPIHEDHGPHYRGYRVDPNASADSAVWFFGCSCVWGWELAEEKTSPYILKKITELNIVNLGVNSAGTAWIHHCVNRLLSQGPRPKAVIIAWPGFSRWLSWNQDGSPVFWAGWALNLADHRSHQRKRDCPDQYAEYKKLFLDERLESISQVDRLNTLRLLKEQAIPCIEFGYSYTATDLLPFNVPVLPESEDTTKDGWHPGPVTQFKTALWLRNQLSSAGLLSNS